jgi:cytochrome P450
MSRELPVMISLDLHSAIALAATVAVLYTVCLAVYRLYFHPLSKFPGSKFAALTLWYEFYYDVVKRGQHIWQIEAMHKRYGPIIRLNPHEVHIDDPEFFDEIYTASSRPRDKYRWWTNLASAHGSGFSTVPHDLHRLRRGVLNPYFSKRSVVRLEPVITAKISKIANRLARASQTSEVVRLDVAFMALTTDILCSYAFADDTGYLDEPDFKLEWKETILGGFESGALMRQFPWLLPMVVSLPIWLVEKGNKGAAYMMRWQGKVKRLVQAVLDEKADEKSGEDGQKTMFHTLRDCDLPPSEKTLQRFCDEGEILLGAGGETTAKALTTIIFYLVQNPALLSRLRQELQSVMPDPKSIPECKILESLPYLSAVISEGLRLSYGVTTRLPRIAPTETLHYKGYAIPPGTPVSQTCYFVLMNPTIFPDPETFDPERWLDKKKRLDRYLVSFGKGSRQCLGINLAYAELYLTAATLVSRFDFELYETSLNDVQIKHDFFVAVPDLSSKGVRVTVKERSTTSTGHSGNLKGLKHIATPDPAHTALVQATDDNSEIDGDALDGGQVESTRRAVKAVEAATKALNDAAAKAMIHEDTSSL